MAYQQPQYQGQQYHQQQQQQQQHPQYVQQQQQQQQYGQVAMPHQTHVAQTYQAPQPVRPNEKQAMHGHHQQQQMHYQQQPQQHYQQHQHQHQHQHHDHDHEPKKSGLSKWSFGLFDCFSPFSTCCISTWCPCYLFGKTYERNKTGEKDPSGFNGMCFAYCATLYCGCAPILQCMQRSNYRDKFNIDGSTFGDFCTACCCSCCALIQEEKDSIVRHTGVDPTTGTAYQPVKGMSYS